MIACRTGYQSIKPFLAEHVYELFAEALIDIGRPGDRLREAPLLRIIFGLLSKMACFFRMDREQKLASIERHQSEWPKPTVHRFDIEIGEARLRCIRMNSTSYLPTLAIMMERPKNALITPNGMHLRKIEFLPLLLALHSACAFSKGLAFMLWSLLPEILLDDKLPFLAHVRNNTLEMLRNVLALGL